MKVKKQITIILMVFIISILLLSTISKAGMEIKSGTTAWKNISVSDAYDECKNLNNRNSVLGSDQLDAHLTLNRDWAAVAYLTMSAYGINSTSNGKTSTTGNETGVKDFGKTYTYTAGAHETGLASATSTNYRQKLIDDQSTKYVELLPDSKTKENTRGMAIEETSGWFSSVSSYCNKSYPCFVRSGVLGFYYGYNILRQYGRS